MKLIQKEQIENMNELELCGAPRPPRPSASVSQVEFVTNIKVCII